MSKEPNPKPVIGLTCRWDEENDWNYLPSEYAASVAAAGGVPVLIPLIPGTAEPGSTVTSISEFLLAVYTCSRA